MQRASGYEEPPFDFWPYLEKIPPADFEGFDCTEGSVDWVWRTDDGCFEHVLINTREDADVFMVLVLDRQARTVHGHRLLNLKREYGIDPHSKEEKERIFRSENPYLPSRNPMGASDLSTTPLSQPNQIPNANHSFQQPRNPF